MEPRKGRFWFVGGLFLILAAGLSGPTDSAARRAGTPREAIPAAFRITPVREAFFPYYGTAFNSLSKRYVAFFGEAGLHDFIISTRLFDAKGRALAGPAVIGRMQDDYLDDGDSVFNAREKQIFSVGCSMDYDAVNGQLLDGSGRSLGAAGKFVLIKARSGRDTAIYPRVLLLPTVNRYLVAWGRKLQPDDGRNGIYFAILNADLTFRVRPRLLRAMATKNTVCAAYPELVGDRILWGSAQDGAGGSVKPVVWFTDLKGNIMTQYGANGLIFPGGSIKGRGQVHAVTGPPDGRILLHWNAADTGSALTQTYRETSYRLMDPTGRFLTPVLAMPRRAAFQTSADAVYNASEKRFFWACAEVLVQFQENPLRQYFGFKLWGYYTDQDGRLVDKKGTPKIAPVALTGTISDPKSGTMFGGMEFNPSDRSYFLSYWTYGEKSAAAWGLIYK